MHSEAQWCSGESSPGTEVLHWCPRPATILLGINLGKLYTHNCFPSPISSRKLEYKYKTS